MPPRPPPPPRPPGGNSGGNNNNNNNARSTEPDTDDSDDHHPHRPNESQTIQVKSADDAGSGSAGGRDSESRRSAEEKARKEKEEEERRRKQKEEEDEDKKPCCTKKCALMPLIIFGYFLLFIFIIVGLALSFAFIIVHFVFRLLHFLFWGMAQVRHSVDEVLDIEKLQADHERQYKQDFTEWEHRQKTKTAEKDRAAAERKRQGKKPRQWSSDDSDEPAPEPNMRVCSFSCVGKSAGACFGMSFNGLAYLWFVLAFMFGFSSISIFTSIFPTCTMRGVTYLSEFRRKYDLDLASNNKQPEEKK